MKKIMKKLLVIFLFVCIVPCVKLRANGTLSFKKGMIDSAEQISQKDLMGVATINQYSIKTYNRGVIQASKLSNHVTTWIEPNISIQDSDLRVVSYSAGSSTHWQGKKPTELAKIYEKENPGWIVIGGINGDFFHIQENCEPLGTFMQETDFYKPFDNNEWGHTAIGFDNDGMVTTGIVETSKYEKLQVLKNDAYESIADIKKIDSSISDTGVSLFTRYSLTNAPYKAVDVKDQELTVDFTNTTVVKVKYETQRLDRRTKKVFVKGVVVGIEEGNGKYKIDDAEGISYLVAKDNSLATLTVGDEVRCQMELTGKWENVTNIISAYNHVLSNYNYVDYENITDVNRDYVNCMKNRTLMGFKEDGTPIMMVVEKGAYGASYEECGEILKAAGCKEGYLFDGGGSSCIFTRNEDGNFVTLNKQEDGTERSDGNAVFFVMRDPGFKVSTKDTTRTSTKVILEKTNNQVYSSLTNIYILVNDKKIPYQEGGIVIDKLNESTTYQITVGYNIPSITNEEKKVTAAVTASFKTLDFIYPEPGFTIEEVGKNYIKVKKDETKATASWIQEVVVHVGDMVYNMGSNNSFTCTELLDDTLYDVFMDYVIVDPETNNRYPMTTKQMNAKTTNFDLPTITLFKEAKVTDSYVSIDYQYSDPDGVVKEAYYLVNGEKISVTAKVGREKINIDLTNKSYQIIFVIEYVDDSNKVYQIKSEELNYKKIEVIVDLEPTPTPSPTKKKCGKKSAELIIALVASASLFGLVLRKKEN